MSVNKRRLPLRKDAVHLCQQMFLRFSSCLAGLFGLQTALFGALGDERIDEIAEKYVRDAAVERNPLAFVEGKPDAGADA